MTPLTLPHPWQQLPPVLPFPSSHPPLLAAVPGSAVPGSSLGLSELPAAQGSGIWVDPLPLGNGLAQLSTNKRKAPPWSKLSCAGASSTDLLPPSLSLSIPGAGSEQNPGELWQLPMVNPNPKPSSSSRVGRVTTLVGCVGTEEAPPRSQIQGRDSPGSLEKLCAGRAAGEGDLHVPEAGMTQTPAGTGLFGLDMLGLTGKPCRPLEQRRGFLAGRAKPSLGWIYRI